MRFSNSHTDGNQSDGENDIEVPIILDNGTKASNNAIEKHVDRSAVLQDVPEEITDAEYLTVEPATREGEETMTPGEFYRAHYKPQVMVRFNTHVFGEPAPGEANDENDNGPLEPNSPGSQYDDDESSDRKASTTSSFYAPERRLTDFSDYNCDDVRHIVIDEEDEEDEDKTPGVMSATVDPLAARSVVDKDEEEDDDTTPGVSSFTANPPAAPTLPVTAQIQAGAPALDEHDKPSPESFNTELITPAHDDIPLPIPPRGSSDQGVARPYPPFDGKLVDRRFLPAKSSFRPSTAPNERPPNALTPAASNLLKRPKLIDSKPRNNTAEGLQLNTTGRRSIDADHERAIEHAGGTPGRPSRLLEERNTPPVPPVPQHLLSRPKPTPEAVPEAAETSRPVPQHLLNGDRPASEAEHEISESSRPVPQHLPRRSEPTAGAEHEVAESSTPIPVTERRYQLSKSDIAKLLDELEDPDVEPTPEAEDEKECEAPRPIARGPWPEDLAKVDKDTKLELIVNQDSGEAVWCRLPIRRLSRPEFWQDKEDQELSKAIRWRDPPPKPQPFQQTGAVIFGEPPKGRSKWTFFYSKKSMPTLKGVMVNDGTGKDHTRGKIKLNIEDAGVYSACGYDDSGQVEWMFQYLVSKREGAKSRRTKRIRVSIYVLIAILANPQNVYPMYFYAVAAFLDPSRGQTLFPFSKAFQPVYESEKMPAPRIGRPPIHNSPPAWNIEEVRSARRAGGTGTPPVHGPPTSAVGRVFGALTGIRRSRPNTPASTDKFPKTSKPSRPDTASPSHAQVDSSGTTPVQSGGLLGGLRHKLAKRPGTSAGIVSIAPFSRSAPLASDLQLKRFDTIASGKSGSGKSLNRMMSKLGLKPSSRPGSARDGHFPRFDEPNPLGPIQARPGLGRRRSKSAASALFPARVSPSHLSQVREESVSGQTDDSSRAESVKSAKTTMGRIRTLSVGARPGSRAKSPLALEAAVATETVEGEQIDETDSTKPKGIMGRLRSMSSASRPGSSRNTPVDHPNFDLEELLSAREAAGSAQGTHDPSTSLVKHTRAPSGSARPALPRSESNTSQISPTPPFVLEELLRARALGSSDSLAGSATSSPIITPARWKGKGKEIIPEIKSISASRRPGSSRESPVWFLARKPDIGSSKDLLVHVDAQSGSSSTSLRISPSPLQKDKTLDCVTIIRGEESQRNSVSLKHSTLSVQDIAEYVDGKFSSSTTSAITLADRSDYDTGPSGDQATKSNERMNFDDAVEMSRRPKMVPLSTGRQTVGNIRTETELSVHRPEPLARKNTFDRLLTAGESLTMQAISTSVQRIVEEHHLSSTSISDDAKDQGQAEVIPPTITEAPSMECIEVLPRLGVAIPRIKSLTSIHPNIPNLTPNSTLSVASKAELPKAVRGRPPTADSYHNSQNKENEPHLRLSKAAPSAWRKPVTPEAAAPTPSLWQRLRRPKSLSNLKAASVSPSPPPADAPPLPPLPKPSQVLGSSPPSFSRGIDSFSQTPKAAGKRPATSSSGIEGPPLPRSIASSSSMSSMVKSASSTGIVLMHNAAPPHLRDRHPFAVAIRPIEGRIEGSEWTNLNPQPTHYLVEDPVFRKAMEGHREETRNTTFPLARSDAGSGPNSAASSASGSGFGRPPLKPILRKRPSTTQAEQISYQTSDRDVPRHLRPNMWNPREISPTSSPLASGPMPPRRGRPSTAQVQR
jgi:hypothetical protein